MWRENHNTAHNACEKLNGQVYSVRNEQYLPRRRSTARPFGCVAAYFASSPAE